MSKKTDENKKSEKEEAQQEELENQNTEQAETEEAVEEAADPDNYRKRTARERVELEPEIVAKTAAEFLTAADNLERALTSECSDENFKKGIQMIYDSFMETLEKLGVEQIPTEGAFDPSMHQAVQQVPAGEGQESGEIAATFQKGYKLGSRILRFAMVAVVA